MVALRFPILLIYITAHLSVPIQGEHPIYQFASKLFDQVAQEKGTDGNILISPFSIRTAMAIMYLGARGQTASQIQKTLQLPSSHGEIITNLARQIQTTLNTDSSTFRLGNGLFLDKSFSTNDSLVSIMKSELGSTVQKLDFKDGSNNGLNAANKWISTLTDGHIRNIFGDNSGLGSSTPSFILGNALFFSGQWEKPFTLLGKKGDFTLNSGKSVKVTMMGLQSTFGYSYIPELHSTGVSLKFKDDRFDLILLKPDEGWGVSKVRPLLKSYPVEKLARKLEDSLRTITLTLPKFTLKANYDAINVLKRMGITELFDPSTSDLSGLASSSSSSASSRPVISKMVHQTLLDVNEVGAVAAAGTAFAGNPISVVSSVDIDKPFLFLLNDRLTGPVLIGQMVNPLNA